MSAEVNEAAKKAADARARMHAFALGQVSDDPVQREIDRALYYGMQKEYWTAQGELNRLMADRAIASEREKERK